MNISSQVKTDVRSFIRLNINSWIQGAKDFGCFEEDNTDGGPEYQITFGLSGDGKSWNYQTGDNSFVGPVYSCPHWAVVYIYDGVTEKDLYEDVIDQWYDLIYQ